MDDTITDTQAVEEVGAEEQALPTEQPEDPAAITPAEPEQTEDTGDSDKEESLPESEDKLKSFAKGQGIEDIDKLSKREKSLLKVAYDNQAEFQRSRQQASELEKTLRTDLASASQAGDQPLVQELAERVEQLTMTQNVNNFFNDGTPEEVAEKKALEPVMAKMVTDDQQLGLLVKRGLISFEQLYSMAKGSDASRDQKLKSDASRETLQKVADKQSAKAVVGSATTSDLSSSEKKDPFLAGFERNGS